MYRGIHFYGPPFTIVNVFNAKTGNYDTPGMVYPSYAALFYLPVPFTKWEVRHTSLGGMDGSHPSAPPSLMGRGPPNRRLCQKQAML